MCSLSITRIHTDWQYNKNNSSLELAAWIFPNKFVILVEFFWDGRLKKVEIDLK